MILDLSVADGNLFVLQASPTETPATSPVLINSAMAITLPVIIFKGEVSVFRTPYTGLRSLLIKCSFD